MIFVVEAIEVGRDGAPVGQWHRCGVFYFRHSAVATAERIENIDSRTVYEIWWVDRPVRYKARIREIPE